MVFIKGWQKTSLINFGSNVIFLVGCNFKYSDCHNPKLVMNYSEVADIDEKEIRYYLENVEVRN